MHATRAAVEEGILPGGGVALLRSVEALKRLRTEMKTSGMVSTSCARRSRPPARQIAMNNAGADSSVVVGKIMEEEKYSYGYDAQAGEYGNLVTKGIIDRIKVVRCALQDAASVAGLLITTEAMVAELPRKRSPMPAMPGGGIGGMDYLGFLSHTKATQRPGLTPWAFSLSISRMGSRYIAFANYSRSCCRRASLKNGVCRAKGLSRF